MPSPVRFFAVFASLLSLGFPASAFAQVQYKIETREVQTVTGTLVLSTNMPDLRAKEWIAFAAVAPELPGQRKCKTSLDLPGAETAKDKSDLGRSLLMARVPAKTDDLKSALTMKIHYTATLYSRELAVAGDGEAANVAPLTAGERKAALAEQGDIDFNGEGFQKWLKDAGYTKRKTEAEIPFAKRVFLGIRDSHTYEYTPAMDRKASTVCDGGKSDCGGLSILYAAVLRANGIPCRTLFGRWATSAKADEKIGDSAYYQWHVKAEFYAAKVGWVPVDLAVSILHDKSSDGLANFGHDPGDFLTQHIDANFQVDTVALGKQSVHNLQEPAFWVSGTGKTTKRTDTESWVVQVKK